MSKATDGDDDQMLAQFRRIIVEVEGLRDRGELTREVFERYWHEAEEVLGDGPEAEAIESLGFLALDISWLPDPLEDD